MVVPTNQRGPRYLKRNRLFNLMLFAMDTVLAVLPKRTVGSNIFAPSRILLVNGAHLGDVVMSTSVLPILKSAYPSAKIGFLVGSWARPIVDGNPMVDFIHTVDHWRLNRNVGGLLGKFRHYWVTRTAALTEIKACQYDIAIDLYTCFPNMIPLLWQAGIPVRIGYVSSGFGPLLTSGLRFPGVQKHETLYQADLLRQLPIPETHFGKQHSTLPHPGTEAVRELSKLLDVPSVRAAIFRVLHMGTGLPAKEWPVEYWRKLAEHLVKDGHRLLFTGVGQREYENIEHVVMGLPNCINGCDRLSWSGYLAAVDFADLLYCTDSLAGHLAAAFGTRCVVVYSGITDAKRWQPMGDACIVITKPVLCAPCHRRQGCREMLCLQGIAPDQVYDLGNKLTEQKSDI